MGAWVIVPLVMGPWMGSGLVPGLRHLPSGLGPVEDPDRSPLALPGMGPWLAPWLQLGQEPRTCRAGTMAGIRAGPGLDTPLGSPESC